VAAAPPSEATPMRYHLVIVTERADWTEAIEGLAPTQAEAVKLARRLMDALPHKIVRCRIRSRDLTAEQVKAIWFDWGRRDAEEGRSLSGKVAAKNARAYRRGYLAGLRERAKRSNEVTP